MGRIESDFGMQYQGRVDGFQTCLAVSVAHHWIRPEEPKCKNYPKRTLRERIRNGISAGLAAKKKLNSVTGRVYGQGEIGILRAFSYELKPIRVKARIMRLKMGPPASLSRWVP